ncbi:MAG TPA: hypothetical protein VK217_09475 [Acidimicrobiales bacterium]|nr:hypothetical protein [Acidimicrobiales bacterium]
MTDVEATAGSAIASDNRSGLAPSTGVTPPVPAMTSRLSKAQFAALSARVRTGHAIARARVRRRIIPPLFVGTAALFGGGLSAAWVAGTLPPPAPAGDSSAASPSQAAELKALDQVRRTLVFDQALVSSLSKAARRALASSEKTTVVNDVGSGATGAGGGVPSTAGSGSGGSLGALPSLPQLPPMPSINIPTTQGTTGATPPK